MKELIVSQKKVERKETVFMRDRKVRSLEAREEELNNKLLFYNLEILLFFSIVFSATW